MQQFHQLLWARRLVLVMTTACLCIPSVAGHAQPAARVTFLDGRRLAIEAKGDSAMAAFQRSASEANAIGDRATESAALRGLADSWTVFRGCADSTERVLQQALSTSSAGDRAAADAMVRLLASRGQIARARSALVKAYADVPGVGRQVTRESITFLQGMAAVDRFDGHEAAALSSLTSALQLAVRLHEGDEKDSSTHAVGAVTEENVWVLYELAQLRLHAKSPSIRSAREGARILDQLLEAWAIVAEQESKEFPVIRIADRLQLRALRCTRNGTACPVPVPPKCS